MTAEPAASRTPVDVTVVVPAYNAADHLGPALDRLLQQTHPSVEIVVVDDGSSDGTAAVARAYAERHDRIVFLAQLSNAGVAAARELAFRQSRGDYVWFVDVDDEWSDDAVRVLVTAARRTGAPVVCANAVTVTAEGSSTAVGKLDAPTVLTGAAAFREFLLGRITGHLWNKLFARSVLDQIAFTRSRQHSDQAMVAQALAVSPDVALIEPVVYRYLLRHGSIIRSGQPRDEALRTVGAVVADTARQLDPALLRSHPFRYYQARFGLLSRLKNATSGAYPPDQAAVLMRTTRAEITLPVLAALVRERDLKRLVGLVAAKLSPRAFGLLRSRIRT